MRLFKIYWVLAFMSVRFTLVGESDAEIRANARILQEHIDAENARIETEARKIYNQKTRSSIGTTSSTLERTLEGVSGFLCCCVLPFSVIFIGIWQVLNEEKKIPENPSEAFLKLIEQPQQRKTRGKPLGRGKRIRKGKN